MSQGDVALNLYDFYVRRPGKPTEKYGLRAYDEIILAPMVFIHQMLRQSTRLTILFQCLFEPRVIEFDHKRTGMRFLTRAPDMAEEMVEQSSDKFTERYVCLAQFLEQLRAIERRHISTDAGHVNLNATLVSRVSSCGEPGARTASCNANLTNTGNRGPVLCSHSSSPER